MVNIEKIINKANEYRMVAIRRIHNDEIYNIGSVCRNSFKWDEENGCSSFDTENRVEMDGTCGFSVAELLDLDADEIEEAEAILHDAIEETSIYGGKAVLIGGYDYEYGNDDNEVVIKNAEVIAFL